VLPRNLSSERPAGMSQPSNGQWIGRRRVWFARPDVRCRLSGQNGGAAQSRSQPGHATFALVVRSRAVSVGALVPYLNEVAGLAVGGVVSAFYGAQFVSAIKNDHLIKTIAALLAALGALILFEVAHPFRYAQVIPAGAAFHFGAGFALGIIIGLVSSIMGVATKRSPQTRTKREHYSMG
jgi:hypothetical protein